MQNCLQMGGPAGLPPRRQDLRGLGCRSEYHGGTSWRSLGGRCFAAQRRRRQGWVINQFLEPYDPTPFEIQGEINYSLLSPKNPLKVMQRFKIDPNYKE